MFEIVMLFGFLAVACSALLPERGTGEEDLREDRPLEQGRLEKTRQTPMTRARAHLKESLGMTRRRAA